jgi:hypothetical protein
MSEPIKTKLLVWCRTNLQRPQILRSGLWRPCAEPALDTMSTAQQQKQHAETSIPHAYCAPTLPGSVARSIPPSHGPTSSRSASVCNANVEIPHLEAKHSVDTVANDSRDFLTERSMPWWLRRNPGQSSGTSSADTMDQHGYPPDPCPRIFSHVEHYSIDLFWSFLSDSFFIAGGFAYIALTVWDYCQARQTRTVGVEEGSDGSMGSSQYLYVFVDVIAPSVYLFNSMVDIHWTTRVQQQLRDQRKQDQTRENQPHDTMGFKDNTCTDDCDDSQKVELQYTAVPMTLRGFSFSSVSTIVEPRWSTPWWRKICKYAAHRRTVWAAVTFGVAASLAVVAALLRNNMLLGHHWSDVASSVDGILDACSDHIYIVSSLISLTGSRAASSRSTTTPLLVSPTPWYSDNERLENWGDILFLLGSLMDGCLYMRSDFVRARQLRQWRRSILQEAELHRKRDGVFA